MGNLYKKAQQPQGMSQPTQPMYPTNSSSNWADNQYAQQLGKYNQELPQWQMKQDSIRQLQTQQQQAMQQAQNMQLQQQANMNRQRNGSTQIPQVVIDRRMANPNQYTNNLQQYQNRQLQQAQNTPYTQFSQNGYNPVLRTTPQQSNGLSNSLLAELLKKKG